MDHGIIHHVSFPSYVFAQHAIVVVVVLVPPPGLAPVSLAVSHWLSLLAELPVAQALNATSVHAASVRLTVPLLHAHKTRGGRSAGAGGVGEKDRQTMKRRDEKTGRDGRRVLPKLARERGEVDKRMLNLDPTFKWTFFNLSFPCFQPTYLPTYLLSQENGN